VLACAAARGPRLGIAGISGGMNSMLADAASEFGMTLPDLAAETMEALGEVVPSYGSAQNPVDIASAILSNPAAVGRALALMEADPGVDITVATINDHPPQLAAALAAGLIEHSAQMVARPVVQWSAGPMSIEGIRALGKAGLAVVTEPDRCARALAAALRSARPPTRVALPTGLPPPPTEWLSESETKALLAAAGLPVPESRVITHPADAPDAVHAVGGLAVIKADCVGIVHKTEAAAVRLGVTPEIAAEVARAVLEGARAAFGPGAVRGVLVERQLQPVAELLVSVRDDPQAGPVLTVALGGTLVEVLGDVASVLAPVDDAGARQLLESLRGAPLLHGWRGAPTVDAEALAHTVAGISALGASWAPDVSILELNPVAGLADGAVILDATAEPAGDAAVLCGGVRAPCPD
jgi:acyl-CoA synthetase (NDP forming)